MLTASWQGQRMLLLTERETLKTWTEVCEVRAVVATPDAEAWTLASACEVRQLRRARSSTQPLPFP